MSENIECKKVYVFEYIGKYKIGVTNNTKKRLKQLSCGCPQIKCIYESCFISNAFEVEKILHNHYRKYCIGGEWFSFIDVIEIQDIVDELGNIQHEKAYKNNKAKMMNSFKINLSKIYDRIFPNHERHLEELNNIKKENNELEKFLYSVNGMDVPNRYSEMVYSILFGKSTEELRVMYNANKYESFRHHLSKEQNETIDNYFKIIIGLTNLNYSFDEIMEFMQNVQQN